MGQGQLVKYMLKILGNRVLVSRIEEEKKEGFQTVEVQDSFVNKGKVEQMGESDMYQVTTSYTSNTCVQVGDTILFSKYSPDTQEVEIEGKKMKLVKCEDILAIL